MSGRALIGRVAVVGLAVVGAVVDRRFNRARLRNLPAPLVWLWIRHQQRW